MTYRLSARAEADLTEIWVYILQRNGASTRLIATLMPCCVDSLGLQEIRRCGRNDWIFQKASTATRGKATSYIFGRFTMRHADRVVANSEDTRDRLIRIGIDPRKITLIYPGDDTRRFRPGLPKDDLRHGLGLRPGIRLLLSVGRLQRRKGFDVVIRSLPLLMQKGMDVHYALIGIGDDHDYLRDLAAELGVADRVHLLGDASPDDLTRWYNAGDLFVMPNREIDGDTEGFGMVFIEAAACAKAVIAGTAGGTGSAVVDGVTGLRVDGEKVEEVAGAIEWLLGDGEYASRLGRQGHTRVLEQFGWEAVAQKTSVILGRG
jgi:phosphatidylinositol alpha-1,6-mannosyltransferase